MAGMRDESDMLKRQAEADRTEMVALRYEVAELQCNYARPTMTQETQTVVDDDDALQHELASALGECEQYRSQARSAAVEMEELANEVKARSQHKNRLASYSRRASSETRRMPPV